MNPMSANSRRLSLTVVLALTGAMPLLAQSLPPPLPPMPVRNPAYNRPVLPPALATNRALVRPPVTPVSAVRPAAVTIPVTPTPAGTPAIPPQPSNPNALVWDADQKEVNVPAGQVNLPFTFSFTNVSSSEVIINSVRTSCGCTTTKLPPMPWHIAPGTNAPLEINLNVAGKFGVVMKTVTVDSTAGTKTLIIKANVPTTPPPAMSVPVPGTPGAKVMESEADRARNQQMALVDRQAVFKGDCASCHVTPGIGKMGAALFTAVCGVCHEAEHRASMVPDLKNLPHATDADHWRGWITYGRVGSLMPSFAKAEGGPLTDQQIASLVDFLVRSHPSKPGAPKSDKAASSPLAK